MRAVTNLLSVNAECRGSWAVFLFADRTLHALMQLIPNLLRHSGMERSKTHGIRGHQLRPIPLTTQTVTAKPHAY